MGTFIAGIFFFILLLGLTFLITSIFTRFINASNGLKLARLIISGIVAGTIVLWFSVSPTTNDEVATIEQRPEGLLITLTGQRLFMVHDPISMLSRSTYADTFKIELPRSNGQINGEEIPTRSGSYSYSGTINIEQDLLLIDLYRNNTDDGTLDELSWNGTYKIHRQSKE
ncbi:hypothetical protein [Reichenbachiella ulvae]|uniref:Uncharacterized protein n=1 Tax=Reichenbachiella ulvae TaxID=2980104 RepID=A0ABT3CTJ0_9BACT|nr:hypothetical protein [Reichenbachiella ulvae]MCV9386988.1 hypothetical protein [Reichenbachiella ulvae]